MCKLRHINMQDTRHNVLSISFGKREKASSRCHLESLMEKEQLD